MSRVSHDKTVCAWSSYDDMVDEASYDSRTCADPLYSRSDDELEGCDGPFPRLKLRGLRTSQENQLTCWPSYGGFWVARNVHPVRLREIGVDRFRKSWRSYSLAEEDEMCNKIHSSGLEATYYPDTDAYIAEKHKWWTLPGGGTKESYGIIHASGVVVCRQTDGSGWILEDNESAFGVQQLAKNALHMREICDLIMNRGGMRFVNVTDSSEMRWRLAIGWRPLAERYGTDLQRS